MPKLSIIIPIYNADKAFLTQCLESIAAQTFTDFEVLAVNDGSVNGCEAVAEDFAGRDRRFKLFSQENAGTSVARNRGLDEAGGEWVMFVDADDFISPDCLKEAARAMEERPVDMLLFGYYTEYTNRNVRRVIDCADQSLWQREALELAVLKGDSRLGGAEVGSPWGKLIKRSVIKGSKVRYTPGLIKGQDTVFILNLMDKCSDFAYLPKAMYHYRIWEKSVSHAYNPRIVEIMEKTLAAYGDFVEENHKGDDFKEAVKQKYYRVLTGEYLELYFTNPGNPAPLRERKAEFEALLNSGRYREAADSARVKGLFAGLMKNAVDHKNIGALFLIKRLETTLKNMVVRQYG